MRDPSLPVQKAIYQALTAALGGVAGIYDEVPVDGVGKVKAAFPYVTIGDDQVQSDADQCHDPSTIYCNVHVWSRAVGKVEAKTIMATVCQALDVKLAVEGFQVIAAAVEAGPQNVPQPDAQTKHLVATFRYRLGPVA